MIGMAQDILGYTLMGNSVLRILICIASIIIGIVAVASLKHVINKKAIGSVDDGRPSIFLKLRRIQKYAVLLIYTAIVYLSLVNILSLSPKAGKIIYVLFVISASFFGLRLVSHVVKASLHGYLLKKDREKTSEQIEQSIRGISTFISIFIWSIGGIFILDNIGFNISAIVTGFGIGGVALALASQTVFRDLFNYFVIFFDQPFKIGDFIVINDTMGTIEKIGIKTTRIASLSGEEIILSNTDLTNGRIHNYKKMEKRRVVLIVGVTYQTTPGRVDAIPDIIREIIERTEGVLFDRSHFKEFGESGLIFESVYFIEGSDYNYYMDRQHHINLQVFKKFNKLKIEFAYPTRTLFLEQDK